MNDFFNLLTDFLQSLTNEEQIWLGILAVLVFLFGVLVGWIVQGSKTRRYKKELLLLRKDRDEYEVRYRTTETKQKALAKELEAVSKEKVAALDQLQGLRNDLGQRDVQLEELRRSNESLSAANQELNTMSDALDAEIASLKAENEQLIIEAEKEPMERSVSGGGAAGAGGGTEESNENLNAYIATSESRFQLLEQRINLLAKENETLRAVPAAPTNDPYTGHRPVMDPNLGTTAPSGEPLVIRADTAESGVRTGQQGETEVIVQTRSSVHIPTIATNQDAQRDDLTLIDNIGPFLQQKLNEADIYRYEQIAGWSGLGRASQRLGHKRSSRQRLAYR